jgi:integrase
MITPNLTAGLSAGEPPAGHASPLTACLEDYLRVRRGLGTKLRRAEIELRAFVSHLDGRGIAVVTVSDSLAWACDPAAGKGPQARTRPLSRAEAIRGFSAFLHALDPRHEVLPKRAVPNPCHRPQPHIYTAEQIEALLHAATQLRRYGRDVTFPALFGLLAVTGMRIGEALSLTRPQADLDQGVLTVKAAKSRDPRLVPLDLTTTVALRRFTQQRPTESQERAFFTHPGGRPVGYGDARRAFEQMRANAGLDNLNPRPRIHDLRHTFAVNTLLNWYENGENVAAKLPVLSTYLGHLEPESTYWYLTAVPELMAQAAARLEQNGTPLP